MKSEGSPQTAITVRAIAPPAYPRFVRMLTVLILVSPLIIWWDHPYPVTAGPVYHVRVFVAALAVLTLFNRPRALLGGWRSGVGVTLAVWCGVLLLTTATSADPQLSMWSTPDRMTGVVDQLTWVLAAVLLAQLVSDWRWAVALGTATGGVLALAAVVEVLVFDEPRAAGLTRNPGFVAIYVSCTTIAAVVLTATSRRWPVWAAIAVLAILAVEMSGTKGAVLGTLAGLGILILLGDRRVKVAAAAAFLSLGLLVIQGPTLDRFTRAIEAAPLAAVEVVKGPSAAPPIGDASFSERSEEWRVAIASFRDRPVVGYGPNAYGVAHRAFAAERFIYADYAHNMLLEELATKGVLGAGSMIALLAMVGRRLWTMRKDPIGLLSLGVLVALAVYGLFWFLTWLMGLWCVLVVGLALRRRVTD